MTQTQALTTTLSSSRARLSRRTLLAGLGAATLVGLTGCGNSNPGPVAQGRADEIAAAMVAAGAVDVAVEIRDGDHMARSGAGVARPGGSAPGHDTITRVASLTKSMVAVVVLQLVDAGELDLDQPATTYASELPTPQGAYTVRQLLQHTSGLGDLTGFLPDGFDEIVAARTRRRTDDEILAAAAQAATAPGGPFTYSNANYVAAVRVAEAVAGQPMAHQLNERVFTPAEMSRTGVPTTAAMPAGSMAGTLIDGARRADTTEFEPSLMSWGANVLSTVADLNRFFRATFDGTLLPAALAEQMRDLGKVGYGLGLLQTSDGCGIGPLSGRAYGNRGNGYGYGAASFHSSDGRRQFSMAWGGTGTVPKDDPIFRASLTQIGAGLSETC